MPEEKEIQIYVVDDDPSVRRALEMLFTSADMRVRTFAKGKEFLAQGISTENACLIIDMNMRGLSGLEVQQTLIERQIELPIIFLTAHDSSDIRQKAKQAGASGYFRKPVDDQALLDSIKWALSKKGTDIV